MSENPTVKKRDMPLAMLLLAAQIVVSWRKLLGLFTGVTSLANGGWLGITGYLVNAATAVIPVIMIVLVFQYATKDKPTAKTVSLLCYILGIAFLLNFGLTLYRYIVLYQQDLYTFFPELGNTCALLTYGIGMLQIGSKLRKNKLREKLRSYGLIFYWLLLVVVAFVAMPAFMDMTITLGAANLLNYALLMVAGFFLPATLLEEGKKSHPVNTTNLVTTICLAAVIAIVVYRTGGSIGYSSYADSHSMPGVTTVTCPVCHKQYTDNGNKRSIQYSNMCSSCKIGFDATKDALGW